MRVPLRLVAPVVAVAGVLVLFTVTAMGLRDGRVVPHLYPVAVPLAAARMLPAALLVVALIIAVVLALRGRDAGRSALVWLGGTGVLPAVGAVFVYVLAVHNAPNEVWVGPPAWIGFTAAFVTVAALVVTAVANRARQTETDGTAEGAPLPLRRSVYRLAGGSAIAVLAAVAVEAVRWTDTDMYTIDPDVVRWIIAASALGTLAVATALTAIPAARGSRVAANLTRAGAVAVLLLLWRVMAVATWCMTAKARADAGDPYTWLNWTSPGGVTAAGAVLFVVCAAGLWLVLAGLAGLADPRSVSYLRRAEPPPVPVHSWSTWTPGGTP